MSLILALILQHSYVVSYRLVLKTIVSVVNLHVVSGWIEWFEHEVWHKLYILVGQSQILPMQPFQFLSGKKPRWFNHNMKKQQKLQVNQNQNLKWRENQFENLYCNL